MDLYSFRGLANLFRSECQYFVVLSNNRFDVLRQTKIKCVGLFTDTISTETERHHFIFFLMWNKDLNENSIQVSMVLTTKR